MANFIHGLNVMACIVAALFFLRFWRRSADRLFVGLTAAFLLLALHWTVLAAIEPQSELRPLVYILRLIAFLVIIAAVLDKNLTKNPPARPDPPSSPRPRTPLE
jgi:hypothetical protein